MHPPEGANNVPIGKVANLTKLRNVEEDPKCFDGLSREVFQTWGICLAGTRPEENSSGYVTSGYVVDESLPGADLVRINFGEGGTAAEGARTRRYLVGPDELHLHRQTRAWAR